MNVDKKDLIDGINSNDIFNLPFIKQAFPGGCSPAQAIAQTLAELKFFGSLSEPGNEGVRIAPVGYVRTGTRAYTQGANNCKEAVSKWMPFVGKLLTAVVPERLDHVTYQFSGIAGCTATAGMTRAVSGATTDDTCVIALAKHLNDVAVAAFAAYKMDPSPSSAASLLKEIRYCVQGLQTHKNFYNNLYKNIFSVDLSIMFYGLQSKAYLQYCRAISGAIANFNCVDNKIEDESGEELGYVKPAAESSEKESDSRISECLKYADLSFVPKAMKCAYIRRLLTVPDLARAMETNDFLRKVVIAFQRMQAIEACQLFGINWENLREFSEENIRSIYRKLCLRCHADKTKNIELQEMMPILKESMEVLVAYLQGNQRAEKVDSPLQENVLLCLQGLFQKPDIQLPDLLTLQPS